MYRRFLPNLFNLAAPLKQLLTKGQAAELPQSSEEQRLAFETMKEAFVSPLTLQLPDRAKTLSVDSDVIEYQAGCGGTARESGRSWKSSL